MVEPGGARLPLMRGLPLENEEDDSSEDWLGVSARLGSFVIVVELIGFGFLANPEKCDSSIGCRSILV